VCEDWFDLPLTGDRYDPMTQRLADRARGYSLASRFDSYEFPSAEFRPGSLADLVHRCLCDPSEGIDIRLSERAEILRDLYGTALRRGIRQRQRAWECVRQRSAPPTSE
jgi:hypothetical protein